MPFAGATVGFADSPEYLANPNCIPSGPRVCDLHYTFSNGRAISDIVGIKGFTLVEPGGGEEYLRP